MIADASRHNNTHLMLEISIKLLMIERPVILLDFVSLPVKEDFETPFISLKINHLKICKNPLLITELTFIRNRKLEISALNPEGNEISLCLDLI